MSEAAKRKGKKTKRKNKMFVQSVVVFETFDAESLGSTHKKKEEGKKKERKKKESTYIVSLFSRHSIVKVKV